MSYLSQLIEGYARFRQNDWSRERQRWSELAEGQSPKVMITEVDFEGSSAFTQRKLRKQIKTRRHWWLSWITGSGTLKDDHGSDGRCHRSRDALGE